MQWFEDGKIQITRNFAIGAAAITIALTLLVMFLIGMLVAGDGDPESGSESRLGNPTEYSTCLVRTYKSLVLDAQDVRFTPWEENESNRSVWGVISYRHLNYIGDHCRDQAPTDDTTDSGTCIPRALQNFYQRHIPEGADDAQLQAIAAEYALTVCQPSAER